MRTMNEETIGHLLSRVCRLSRERLRLKMAAIGLHRGQGFVLSYLWHNDGIPSVKIARRPDPDDQRVVRIHLTDKARSLKEEISDSFRELEEEMTGVLTDDEEETLRRLLAKVHSRLVEVSKRRGEGR